MTTEAEWPDDGDDRHGGDGGGDEGAGGGAAAGRGDDGHDGEDADDTGETRSMQAQILAQSADAGLIGLALGALTAAGATVWLKVRRRG